MKLDFHETAALMDFSAARTGIRSLDTLIELYSFGARRFKLGLGITEQCTSVPAAVDKVKSTLKSR